MQTHVSAIERNIELTNIWLSELCSELNDIDKEDAWQRLGAVLQTVRDRMPVNEAADFAAQLPTLIRGEYFESWRPETAPHKWRRKDEYLDAVNAKLGPRPAVDAEETTRAVLKVAKRHMDANEIEKVRKRHTKEMWDLWPQ